MAKRTCGGLNDSISRSLRGLEPAQSGFEPIIVGPVGRVAEKAEGISSGDSLERIPVSFFTRKSPSFSLFLSLFLSQKAFAAAVESIACSLARSRAFLASSSSLRASFVFLRPFLSRSSLNAQVFPMAL